MKRFISNFDTIVFLLFFISLPLARSESYPTDENSWALLVEVADYKDERIIDLSFNDNILDKLQAAFEKIGGYNPEHIEILKEGQNTLEGIRDAFSSLSERIFGAESFIFYFRGHIGKPSGTDALSLMPFDARKGDYGTHIWDKQLNQWLDKLNAAEKIVIIDCYTEDENIDAYRVNRETLGTSAFISIQPATSVNDGAVISDRLLDGFWKSENIDLDENRVVSVDDIYQYVYENGGLRSKLLSLRTEFAGMLASTDNLTYSLPLEGVGILRFCTAQPALFSRYPLGTMETKSVVREHLIYGGANSRFLRDPVG